MNSDLGEIVEVYSTYRVNTKVNAMCAVLYTSRDWFYCTIAVAFGEAFYFVNGTINCKLIQRQIG